MPSAAADGQCEECAQAGLRPLASFGGAVEEALEINSAARHRDTTAGHTFNDFADTSATRGRRGSRGRAARNRESSSSSGLSLDVTLPRGLTKVSLTVPVRVPLLAAPEEFSHQLFALLGVAILPRDCASGRSRSVRQSHGAEPVST